jgi:hypothetical protein
VRIGAFVHRCGDPREGGIGLVRASRDKVRNVGAQRQRDSQRLDRILRIELRQPAAHIVGGYAHDGIGAGVVVAAAMEDLHAEKPFLQAAGVARKRPTNQVLQELRRAPARGKVVAGEHHIQVLADLLWAQRTGVRRRHISFVAWMRPG